jgi:hypothetical protein
MPYSVDEIIQVLELADHENHWSWQLQKLHLIIVDYG